ncbi:hypothetical protein [Micromonospora zhanjiangensis]|uniref:Sensory transduction regulator n=1 Tax=Micromonospora zhanjiangensis TaxID=1522057 RepID=A0ABV8KXT0_9ACTN
MSSYGPAPKLGNLAWAPLPTVDAVEIFDRFNGVPTLGVVRAEGDSCLFWRVISDDDKISAWLYVPLTDEDERYLSADDDNEVLDTIVFGSRTSRYTTIGIATSNRLVFEREWQLPRDLSPDEVAGTFLEFALEAMTVALEQDPPLPPSRRQIVQNASDAVRHMAPV